MPHRLEAAIADVGRGFPSVALRAALAGLLVLVVVLRAPAVSAQPGLFVGVTDDALISRPGSAAAEARDLGLTAFRVSLGWARGQSELSAADIASFDGMVAASTGLRIVVTVYGRALAAPLDNAGREAYCTYVRDLLTRYPMINDIVIWNEPNLGYFWQPQFNTDGISAAPAAYEALLARCWDVLHAFRPGVNIIMTTSPSGNDDPAAASNVSHSPGSFIRKMGAAYRASGRTQPIFDTVGHNPYGLDSAESPWRQHLTPSHVAEGDLDRLVQALDDGFGGSSQPVPGKCAGPTRSCPSIWYLEAGYQTIPDGLRRQFYTGQENDDHAIPDGAVGAAESGPTQSTQLADGLELAYCQPFVGAFFNFLLWDEPDLARWQSGVLWADGSRKASFDALRRVVNEVKAGDVDCARLKASRPTAAQSVGGVLVERIEWSPMTAFSSFNEIWRFALDARADATYRATVVAVGRGTAARGGKPALQTAGSLRGERPRVVQFPEARVHPGTYRIEVVVTRKRPSLLTVTRTSPTFVVE